MPTTDNPDDPRLTHGADEAPAPQADVYLVLSEAERDEYGFVRPFWGVYRHITCGTTTRMSPDIAATYASRPHFYGATYCATCGMHRPVGEDGEFVWPDGVKVGT